MSTTTSLLEQSDEETMKITRQLQTGFKLKRTLRYGTKRDFTTHSESVAEHVFALLYLAQYFLPLEDPDKKLSAEEIYRIMLFHDFGEITHGDVPYHLKTKEHEEQEREDAKAVFASLPSPLSETGLAHWQSYEDQKSSEAQFVYALDKIEPLFELLDPVNELSMKRLKFSYRDHMGKKARATEHFPHMRKFLEVISADMLRRNIFWVEE